MDDLVAIVVAVIIATVSGPAEPAEETYALPVRGEQVQTRPIPPPPTTTTTTTTVPPVPTGLFGLPFAPPGLSACDNAEFYRVQWGLPTVFRKIVYNESRCRNEESVHTFCCWGRYQLYVSLHLRSAYAQGYARCGVTSRHDIDSNTELDKQRGACAAKVVYDISGTYPWKDTR